MPYRAIKTNIADSLNIIVQIERRPGSRFVSQVLQICGYHAETDRYDFEEVFAVDKNLLVPYARLGIKS
jgi:Flp pilus assembly CpaF family ATPase